MRQSIEISKAEKDSMIGELYNDTAYFNPVLHSSGKWCISIECVNMITNPAFTFLQARLEEEYTNVNEATSLSDVFNSNELTSSDLDTILGDLYLNNSLVRKDIRIRGISPSSLDDGNRNSLMDDGVLLLYSK